MDAKKVILFDFDGVLAHTLEHAFSIHKLLNPQFLWEEFQKMGEGNFHAEYRKKFEAGGHVHPENYPEEYSKKLAQMNLESELAELVTELSLIYTLYIVSSTKTSYIQDFLEREKVLTYFTDVLGADIHESKVVKIKSVLEKEMVVPSQCLFITDTTGDVREASECDVPSVCVSWGLHSRERLEKKNPFTVVDTPKELRVSIDTFFATI
jgi:phosphoglycolate phosphatase-like HAD superfamily hydrolase